MHIFFYIVIHVCVYMYYNNNNVIYSLFSDFFNIHIHRHKVSWLKHGKPIKTLDGN